jgi:hypothetical protein
MIKELLRTKLGICNIYDVILGQRLNYIENTAESSVS